MPTLYLTLTNPTFETGDFTGWSVSNETAPPDGQFLIRSGTWTGTSGIPQTPYAGTYCAGWHMASSGSQGGSITQSVSAAELAKVKGKTVTMTWWHSAESIRPSYDYFRVYMGDGIKTWAGNSAPETITYYSNGTVWTQYTRAFPVDANATSLWFRFTVHRHSSGIYPYVDIDNITISYDPTNPTVTAGAVSAITATTATAHGTLWSLPTGYTVTQGGHCWSSTSNPVTTADSKTELGAIAEGNFSSSMTTLTEGTYYRVRAYVVANGITFYSNQVGFTAGKGTVYPTWDRARVSSIRHIYKPGLFVMQAGVGDISLDIDIAELYVKNALSTKEKEIPPSIKEALDKAKEAGSGGYHVPPPDFMTVPGIGGIPVEDLLKIVAPPEPSKPPAPDVNPHTEAITLMYANQMGGGSSGIRAAKITPSPSNRTMPSQGNLNPPQNVTDASTATNNPYVKKYKKKK